MKPLVLLQARSSSTRLPFKVLMLIKNMPSIIYLYKRIFSKKYLTYVLISNHKDDEFLSYILKKNKILFFRGDLNNVRKRFLDFTKKLKNNRIIVRVTGDNLLIDSKLINYCIKIFKNKKKLYLCLDNKKDNLPYGISLEIFRLKLLRQKGIKSSKSDEHVTYYFKKKSNNFNLKKFFIKKMSTLNCTMDYLEDYIFLKNHLNKYSIKTQWNLLCKNLKKYKIKKKNKLFLIVKKTYQLSNAEINKIIKLKRIFWKHNALSQKIYFYNSYKKKDIHFMMYNKKKLIGYICLKLCNHKNIEYGLLDSLIVSPLLRGFGISNILMSKSLNKIILLKRKTFLYANKNSLTLHRNYGWKLSAKKNYLPTRPKKVLMYFPI
jgi:spore coat polysaccharide biosynthesis protein SpsF (cytidylyltransferase family)